MGFSFAPGILYLYLNWRQLNLIGANNIKQLLTKSFCIKILSNLSAVFI
jgi:hypothetical protein